MNQNAVIPCIVRLSKLMALTIDNYFTGYEILKKNEHFQEYERQQIRIHTLRDRIMNGFSWYCGSTIANEEKKMNGDFHDPENKNPVRQQYNLLNLILEENRVIRNGLVANENFKQIFEEIQKSCEKQLNLIAQMSILTKKRRKRFSTHHHLINQNRSNFSINA